MKGVWPGQMGRAGPYRLEIGNRGEGGWEGREGLGLLRVWFLFLLSKPWPFAFAVMK